MCIYFFSSRYLFSFSLNIRISVRQYCDTFLRLYIYVYFYVDRHPEGKHRFTNTTGFQLHCHWLSVYSWLFISVLGYIVTDCTYIGTSLIPRFCLSLSLCIFQCPGILHVCKQARSARSVSNSALEKVCMIILNSVYIPTSLHSYFYLSLSIWVSVPVSRYIMIHCMCIYVAWSCLFFSFSLNICSSVPLYCHSL